MVGALTCHATKYSCVLGLNATVGWPCSAVVKIKNLSHFHFLTHRRTGRAIFLFRFCFINIPNIILSFITCSMHKNPLQIVHLTLHVDVVML